MARYDKTTLDFIEKVSGVKPDLKWPKDEEEKEPFKDALKAARTAIKLQREPEKTVAKSLVGKATSELLKMAKASPLAIYGELNSRFKDSWWDWEPETIWKTLKDGGFGEASEELKNLVMALQVCVKTDAPFEHWHVFEKVAHAFSQNPVDFGILQPLELTDAARAVRILRTLRPKEKFEREVSSYLASLARSSGVVYLPDEFFPEEANSELLRISYDSGLQKEVSEAWRTKAKTDDLVINHQIEMLKEIREFSKNG